MGKTNKAIVEFMEIEKKSIDDSRKKEKKRYVNIDPHSYIGKEIRYQTAVLKNIENQNEEILGLLRKAGN